MKREYSGFSFLEIIIVLFLVGLIATIVTPQFFAAFEKTNNVEFRHLNRLFNMLRTDAILGSTQYFVIFDPKTQSYHVEQQQKGGERVQIENPQMLRPRAFPENFMLENLSLTRKTTTDRNHYVQLLKTSRKPLTIQVDSSGFVTPFALFFGYEEDVWVIQTKNIMGFLEMAPLEELLQQEKTRRLDTLERLETKRLAELAYLGEAK